jgi:hypothetical protein
MDGPVGEPVDLLEADLLSVPDAGDDPAAFGPEIDAQIHAIGHDVLLPRGSAPPMTLFRSVHRFQVSGFRCQEGRKGNVGPLRFDVAGLKPDT